MCICSAVMNMIGVHKSTVLSACIHMFQVFRAFSKHAAAEGRWLLIFGAALENVMLKSGDFCGVNLGLHHFKQEENVSHCFISHCSAAWE